MTSFPAAWERYRRHLVERGRRPKSLNRYRAELYAFVAYLEGRGRTWDRATPNDLRKFLALPPRGGKNVGGVKAANTRSGQASIVCCFYRFVYDHRMLGRDRMRGAVRPRAGRPVPRALDLPDIQRLLAAAAGRSDQRLLTMIWLMYGCGLRCAETAAARVEHVRLRGDPPRLLVPPSKNDRERLVPLAPPVAAHLRRLLDGMPTTGPLIGNLRRPGEHLAPHSVGIMVANFMHDQGVRESGHSLRHSFATHLLAAGKGKNLYSVSKALGHASTEVTERVYTSGYIGELGELAALLPDPRTGHRPKVERDPAVPEAWLPVDLTDQLDAALAVLGQHGEQVAQAMRTVGRVTRLAWLRSLGLEREEQLRDVDLDAADIPSDEQWEAFEAACGIRRGWSVCDQLRDAHPDG